MIAVCIPSRGLMYSPTMEDVVANMWGHNCCLVMSHGRPVPEANNWMIKKALKYEPTHIWMVDDDMKLPFGILSDLLKADADVAVADYPVAVDQHTVHIRDGVFEAAGLGCVLVKSEVFAKLEEPYFRVDKQYMFNGVELAPNPVPPTREPEQFHGLHDVDWWYRVLRIPGLKISVIDQTAGQYIYSGDVKKFGNHTNYEIKEWVFK